jgi:hypothetical protein
MSKPELVKRQSLVTRKALRVYNSMDAGLSAEAVTRPFEYLMPHPAPKWHASGVMRSLCAQFSLALAIFPETVLRKKPKLVKLIDDSWHLPMVALKLKILLQNNGEIETLVAEMSPIFSHMEQNFHQEAVEAAGLVLFLDLMMRPSSFGNETPKANGYPLTSLISGKRL